jgi:hypothetical protein
MLDIKNFYTATLVVILFVLFLKSLVKFKAFILDYSIGRKIVNISLIATVFFIYFSFADILNFPDVASYLRVDSSEAITREGREPLTVFFVDVIQPLLPQYTNVSPFLSVGLLFF